MELLEQIKQAGVVDCGGAGFPTHAKLNCRVDTFIVNGAECEPLLRTDRWLMCRRAAEIVSAAAACGSAVGAGQIYIALKAHYTQAIKALTKAIEDLGSPVKLFRLQNFYPAGDEQALVLEVTGRVVPPAGIPLDAGAVVSNAATMSAVYDAVQGEAFTQKCLTVTGEVARPAILRVPLGTPLLECVEAAGGTALADYRVLCGGPMMGKLYTLEEARRETVTKTASGITVLPPDIPLVKERETPLRVTLRRAKTSCIQCSRCTDLCPRRLSGRPLRPHMIMRKLAYAGDPRDILGDEDVRQALLCSQCGVCEVYACPMGLQPRQVNIFVKGELVGTRYERTGGGWMPQEAREWRKAPSRRMAVRLGVGKYYDYEIDTLLTPEVRRVHLPLKQHIGVPAVPEVRPGDTVALGQRIASCPDGAMGAHLCASISGVVTEVDGAITIERGNA